MSEMLVGALAPSAQQLGLTQVLVGVILVALLGNAAKHSTAVMVALKNDVDLAYGIAVGSSLQNCVTRCPIARLCQLSLRDAIGSDLHTVRGGYSDDFGPDRGIRGDGRRIELDGRCEVGRSVPDAGHRLFLPTRLTGC